MRTFAAIMIAASILVLAGQALILLSEFWGVMLFAIGVATMAVQIILVYRTLRRMEKKQEADRWSGGDLYP